MTSTSFSTSHSFIFLILFCICLPPYYGQTLRLHSVSDLRQGGNDAGYTLDGLRMIGSRRKLLNTVNFGDNGTYQKTIDITDEYFLSGTLSDVLNRTDIDLFFFGAFDKLENSLVPFTPQELDDLWTWSQNGGKLIIAASALYRSFSYDPEILNSRWGFEIEPVGGTNIQLIPTAVGSQTAIFNGPFGQIPGHRQGGGAQGYFSKLPPNSIVLAVDQSNRPTLIFDCETLDLITADVDVYTDLSGVSNNFEINTVADQFWANTIVFMDQELAELPNIKRQEDSLRVGDYLSYSWTLNGDSLENGDQASIRIFNPGTYQVTVTDKLGCSFQTEVTIPAEEVPETSPISVRVPLIPNIITPNDDDLNDRFVIPGEFLGLTSEIFDRWGRPVWTGDPSGNGWDGTQNGRPASEGVYYVLTTGNWNDGFPFTIKTKLTLLR